MSERAQPSLVLASTSVHRQALLERLKVPFRCVAPQVDERHKPGEAPVAVALRLARLKAEAVAARASEAVVIGADQVAVRGADLLGKPGDAERCRQQLAQSAGRDVIFHTAVCVIQPRIAGRSRASDRLDEAPSTGIHEHVDRTTVWFRPLTTAEIARYVEQDRPWDCAGGFKAESLGITLFERIESVDPTALTGLPLIWLADVLRRCGFSVP